MKFSLSDKRSLSGFAAALSKRTADGRGFTCLVTDDAQLRALNRDFLGHDYATDVLSFSAGELDPDKIGEIAISAERAEAQAREFGHGTLDEIRILMLHGVLHLTGLDHEQDNGEMRRAERKWRREFSLPLTLIARSSASAAVERGR